MHPNWQCHCEDFVIDELNKMNNVYLWNWADSFDFHFKWKEVHKIPLAFDSISYSLEEDSKFKFDCCFVGGWADNGLNEKRNIILQYLRIFKDSGLKCGFFINRGLTHQQENNILSNSIVSINIHDAYQQKLGLDCNERTFKSLGLCGIMVSDRVKQIENLFPSLPLAKNPEHMLSLVKEYLSKDKDDIESIKSHYRDYINENHTYIKRVQKLRGLK